MPSSTRPPLEPLEARRLFAAIGLGRHVLTVTGTGGVANTITVGLSADGLSVVATDGYQTGRGQVTTPRLLSRTFPLSRGIRLVRIQGGGGNDTITIDQTNGSFPIPAKINGGAGDDSISGGDEPDRIDGQGGSDTIRGGGGNDILFGGKDSDALYGGPGNDYLAGEGNNDLLQGDDGNDTIHDAVGPDTVLGGAGADRFEIHSLKRDTFNDYNAAEDKLKIIDAPKRGNNDDDNGLGNVLGDLFPISSFF